MAETEDTWLELVVEAEPEAVEAITELFARYGYNQGVVIEEPVKPGPDGGVARDPCGLVTIRTYLPVTREEKVTEEDVSQEARGLAQENRIEKLKEGLFYLGMIRKIGPLQVTRKHQEDWANAWKEFYQAHRVGRRTVIKPPWQPYDAKPEELVIEIDPGMAFGTGLHPTTRLCLTLLEDFLRPATHKNLLDLGTGSGILAIAAAKLGSARVIGVDTDPVAIRAARENVDRNSLSGQIVMETGSLAVEPGVEAGSSFYTFSEEDQKAPPVLVEALPFDGVIANIIARILVALAPSLAKVIKPGGLLISSGIISEKAAEVEVAFEANGFSLLERREESDWVAFAHRKEKGN